MRTIMMYIILSSRQDFLPAENTSFQGRYAISDYYENYYDVHYLPEKSLPWI